MVIEQNGSVYLRSRGVRAMADQNKAEVSYVNPPSLEPPPGY